MRDHLWVLDEIEIILICARCGMDKEEWKTTGKPPCRDRIEIPPEDSPYGAYL